MNKVTIKESELPTPEHFIRNLSDDKQGNRCSIGWYRKLIIEKSKYYNSKEYLIFNNKFIDNADAMNLKFFESDASKNPGNVFYNKLIWVYNDHPDNSFEDICECFNKTMKDLGYVE